jgi:hypothetical protein
MARDRPHVLAVICVREHVGSEHGRFEEVAEWGLPGECNVSARPVRRL